MRESVILSAVRTPTGRFLGALSTRSATDLGAIVVAEAVRRAGLDRALVDECLMGNVVTAGEGQHPARQAALHGGLATSVAALTINKVCGSGLKAVMLADQGIRAGDIDCAVAGGMESMSQAPHLLSRARLGLRLGDATLVDALLRDGLWCAFEDCHMGEFAERVAQRYHVSREAQDAYAAGSHQKAAAAADGGLFGDEILPVPVQPARGAAILVDRDETIRADTTVATLARLSPAFRNGGTVTAGNAAGLNDGASALVVMDAARASARGLTPMARIVGQATSGVAPGDVLMAPVEAVQRLLAKIGWTLADVELLEINEAFAVQMVAVIEALGVDPTRVNVHGGAVALGHAIGSSGARILTTLLFAMKARGARRAVAALCLGGGNGVALAVERT